MISRRILYGLILVAVLLFQITNYNYLAHFLLVLTIALPLLSLVLSLPGMLSCRLWLAAEPDAVERGAEARWTLTMETLGGLPLSRMVLRLEWGNLFLGQRKKERMILFGQTRRSPLTKPADTDHCGLLEFRVTKVRVYDYLGLFSIGRPLPPAVRLLCGPVPVTLGNLNIPEGQGSRPGFSGTTKRGWGEDYDLREYRPGDPMRSVHWKLTSKWDKLIVREATDSVLPLPLFTFDRFGDPDLLDRTLDKLLGCCRSLLAVQRPFGILWLEGEEPVFRPVSDEKELRDALLTILSTPVPRTGASILERPELICVGGQPVIHIHIDGKEEDHG